MTAQTRLSAKGQVVIPKDVRDRLGWAEGTVFDVFERGEEVVLRVPSQRKKMTFEEATARIRSIVKYDGPPISDEEIASVGPRMAAEKFRRLNEQSQK